jgi:hypothetical protein
MTRGHQNQSGIAMAIAMPPEQLQELITKFVGRQAPF